MMSLNDEDDDDDDNNNDDDASDLHRAFILCLSS